MQPTLVLVGLGFPKQERLIRLLRAELPETWFVGVGISLSFLAGDQPRAPAVLQRLGLEWMHRLWHEPRRLFRRYVVQGIPFSLKLFTWALMRRLRRRDSNRLPPTLRPAPDRNEHRRLKELRLPTRLLRALTRKRERRQPFGIVTAVAGASRVSSERGSEAAPSMERLVGIGVSWKLTGQIAIQLIRLLTVAILARFLTPADYGAAAIAIALTQFAPTVADMGIGSALVQAKTATPVVRSTAFWASIGFGVALFVRRRRRPGPSSRFLGDPDVARDGGRRWPHLRHLLRGLDEPGHVHARDESSGSIELAQLACVGHRGVDRRHSPRRAGRGVGAGPAAGRLHDDSRGRPLVARPGGGPT